jgi:hypothetical protein
LHTVVNAVNSKTSGIIAWLDNPDIAGAICGVLWYFLLHLSVKLEDFANGEKVGPLPTMIPINKNLSFVFLWTRVADYFLKSFELLLTRH